MQTWRQVYAYRKTKVGKFYTRSEKRTSGKRIITDLRITFLYLDSSWALIHVCTFVNRNFRSSDVKILLRNDVQILSNYDYVIKTKLINRGFQPVGGSFLSGIERVTCPKMVNENNKTKDEQKGSEPEKAFDFEYEQKLVYKECLDNFDEPSVSEIMFCLSHKIAK